MLQLHQPEFPGLCLVISGGQAGADQGGLAAALELGVETSGVAPLGYRTCKGSAPWLRDLYGLVESSSADYAVRTKQNVLAGDGTLLVGSDLHSVGSLLTHQFCLKHKKPVFKVELTPWLNLELTTQAISAWVQAHRVEVLNVAGNRDRRGLLHHETTRQLVKPVLLDLQKRGLLVTRSEVKLVHERAI